MNDEPIEQTAEETQTTPPATDPVEAGRIAQWWTEYRELRRRRDAEKAAAR